MPISPHPSPAPFPLLILCILFICSSFPSVFHETKHLSICSSRRWRPSVTRTWWSPVCRSVTARTTRARSLGSRWLSSTPSSPSRSGTGPESSSSSGSASIQDHAWLAWWGSRCRAIVSSATQSTQPAAWRATVKVSPFLLLFGFNSSFVFF